MRKSREKYIYQWAVQQIAMEAPLLFSAFLSLLQGTLKILVGGQAECLFMWSQGREKVFHSHDSDGGWLKPSPALCWTHTQASPSAFAV